MSLLNTAAYESQIQNFAEELQRVDAVKDAAFNAKDRANEILKTIGEAKMFLSGKPVTNYLISKGKAGVQAAIDKAGLKLDELRGKSGDSAAEAESAQTEGQAGPAIRAVDEPATGETSVLDVPQPGGPFGETPIASTGIAEEEIPLNTLGAHGMANEFQGIETPNPAFDPSTAPQPSDLDLLSEDQAQSLFEPPAGAPSSTPLAQQTADIEKVASVKKADFQAEKSLARDGKPVGKGEADEDGDAAAGEEGGEVGGEEAASGVLDFLPGADIIGLLIGGAVTIAALAKKPHEHLPVDKISASFQAGIGG